MDLGASGKLEPIIRRAIRERRPVALEYRRLGQGLRTVHPHVLYRASTGEVAVDTYQVEGYTSDDRELPGWRRFELDQLVSAALLDGGFTVRPDFNPTATKYGGGIIESV